MLEERYNLVCYRAAPSRVCCPLQAEAVALREAILFVKGKGLQSCTFLTDSQTLAQVCSSPQPPLDADWRAYKEINDIWCLLQDNDYICSYISRSQLVMADYLAKGGRTLEEGFTRYTYPSFNF